MYIGITAEWNPFHSGHAHMLRSLKNLFPDAPIISAMSGSFVQRGEPAILINGHVQNGRLCLVWMP